jgi:putative tryptophan/tyrosine transport system substrate-binding protein
MRRRLLLFAAVAGLAGFGSSPVYAANATEMIARVGYVDPESRSTALWGWPAFWQRLGELGWVEGRNLIVEARFANGHVDRLPSLMQEVIRQKVDVIFTYTFPGAIAAKEATSTTPIVFAGFPDPVGSGLVASLSRPGGNLTGLSTAWDEGRGLGPR